MKGNNRFFFKACPRCRGDMYLDDDAYGAYGKCLQCGRIYELGVNRVPANPTNERKMGRPRKLAA